MLGHGDALATRPLGAFNFIAAVVEPPVEVPAPAIVNTGGAGGRGRSRPLYRTFRREKLQEELDELIAQLKAIEHQEVQQEISWLRDEIDRVKQLLAEMEDEEDALLLAA